MGPPIWAHPGRERLLKQKQGAARIRAGYKDPQCVIKMGPATNIGLVCCGGRTETRNKDAQVNIRPARWPELRYVASDGLLALSTQRASDHGMASRSRWLQGGGCRCHLGA
jgi:hypothetical protein